MSLENNTIITQLYPNDKTQLPYMVECEIIDPKETVSSLGGVSVKRIAGSWYQRVSTGWVKVRRLGELVREPVTVS